MTLKDFKNKIIEKLALYLTLKYYLNIFLLNSERLKAYSLMLNRGRSQNFQIWIFLHIFVALLY